jgi:hypothetical protein
MNIEPTTTIHIRLQQVVAFLRRSIIVVNRNDDTCGYNTTVTCTILLVRVLLVNNYYALLL